MRANTHIVGNPGRASAMPRQGPVLAAAAALLLGLAAPVAATVARADASSPIGTWQTQRSDEGRYLHIEITPCAAGSATLCGTIVGAFGGARPGLVGRRMIWDMAPDGGDRWDDGRVWAPDDDDEYSAKMHLKDADTLELSGCVFGGLICRGQDWRRVE
ncbi:MAG: DUF2147 domain-containing protein [Pseudomonadota bacterium]